MSGPGQARLRRSHDDAVQGNLSQPSGVRSAARDGLKGEAAARSHGSKGRRALTPYGARDARIHYSLDNVRYARLDRILEEVELEVELEVVQA